MSQLSQRARWGHLGGPERAGSFGSARRWQVGSRRCTYLDHDRLNFFLNLFLFLKKKKFLLCGVRHSEDVKWHSEPSGRPPSVPSVPRPRLGSRPLWPASWAARQRCRACQAPCVRLSTRLPAPPSTPRAARCTQCSGGRGRETLCVKFCKQLYYKKHMLVENKVYLGKFLFLCFFFSPKISFCCCVDWICCQQRGMLYKFMVGKMPCSPVPRKSVSP